MSENVVNLPTPEKDESFLIGPFEEWRVCVQGRIIPRLTGYRHEEGTYGLTVDRRFGATFPDMETARGAAWLIAQALAVGEGYSHCEAESKNHPFAPIGRCIGFVK